MDIKINALVLCIVYKYLYKKRDIDLPRLDSYCDIFMSKLIQAHYNNIYLLKYSRV